MLTAFDSLDERVAGLGLGADDYLVKPFHLRELVARIHALGRRPAQSAAPVLEVGDCRLDPHQRVVHRAYRVIGLTPKEFGVLEVLMKQSPAPVSAELLLEKVWDEHADPFTNAVRVTMVTLRRKLGAPPLVETVKSVGYQGHRPRHHPSGRSGHGAAAVGEGGGRCPAYGQGRSRRDRWRCRPTTDCGVHEERVVDQIEGHDVD